MLSQGGRHHVVVVQLPGCTISLARPLATDVGCLFLLLPPGRWPFVTGHVVSEGADKVVVACCGSVL
jgi:hypothetical protein